MQKYELVLLLDHTLKSDDREKLLKDIESGFGDFLIKKDDIGLQNLYYGLRGDKLKDKAYFVSYYFQIEPTDLTKIKDSLLYNKSILRYKFFRMNKNDVLYVFVDLQKQLNEIVDSWGKHRFGQKVSFFSDDKNKQYLNWKAIPILKKYITRFGDIKPRKYTLNKLKTQKKLRRCALRARELGLVEYLK